MCNAKQYFIASVSFGKDSLCMLLYLIWHNEPLDEVVFYDTGMEFQAIYDTRELLKPVYIGDFALKLHKVFGDDPGDKLLFMPAAAMVLETRETQNAIHITYENGQIAKYEKTALTRAWLTISNDTFFRQFGFNWIPPLWLQEKAKSELFAPQSGVGLGTQIAQLASTSPVMFSGISTCEVAKAIENATRGLYSALNGDTYD